MSFFSDLAFEAELIARSIGDYFAGGGLRLGVTGLSRSGKTVFLTALVSNLIAGVRLPVLAASAEGRITRARLEPQPDDAVPRFAYEDHLASLAGPDRTWPQSTRRISQLRLTIEFESAARWNGRNGRLTLDLVDYPGEWLLDLPLIDKSYATWARETLAASETPARSPLSADWRAALAGLDPHAEADEDRARDIAERFTAYLRKARENVYALSTLPPGRFLMPGDLEGSPALTFAPVPIGEGDAIAPGTMAAMMERRYEAYKTHVVKPFFRDHFARLDRQIVLVDALTALNSGPAALSDLENALAEVLAAFRAGRASSLRLDCPPAHRPHPVRRDQGRPPASHQPRPARGDLAGADRQGHRPRRGGRRRDRRHRARGDPRHPRSRDPPARRNPQRDHRHAGDRRDDRRRHVRRRRRGRGLSGRASGRSVGDLRRRRASRWPRRTTTGASFASGRRSLRAASRPRRSGSTAPCNS